MQIELQHHCKYLTAMWLHDVMLTVYLSRNLVNKVTVTEGEVVSASHMWHARWRLYPVPAGVFMLTQPAKSAC